MSASNERRQYFLKIQDTALNVEATPEEGHAQLRVEGHDYEISGEYRPGAHLYLFEVNGEPVRLRVESDHGMLVLSHRGRVVHTRAMTAREHELYALMPEKQVADTSNLVCSPMPGKVLQVHVSDGEAVKAGQALCVVEAMKMENVLHAERDGVIEAVHVEPGSTVNTDQELMRFVTE